MQEPRRGLTITHYGPEAERHLLNDATSEEAKLRSDQFSIGRKRRNTALLSTNFCSPTPPLRTEQQGTRVLPLGPRDGPATG